MKSVVALLPLLLLGCHMDLVRNSPGHVDLSTMPPSTSPRAIEPPKDPGQRSIVLHASVLGGGGVTSLDGATTGFGHVGFEASLTSNDLDHGVYGGIIGPRDPWRANLGWMAFRTSDGKDRTGPSYAELQYTAFHALQSVSLAVGGAWEWSKVAAGPQASACVGAIPVLAACLRGTYLVGEGAEIGVHVVMMAGLLEWAWKR